MTEQHRYSLSSAEGQVIEGVTEIKFFEGNEPMYLTPDPPAQTRHSHLRQKQKRVARPVDQWTAVDRLTEEVSWSQLYLTSNYEAIETQTAKLRRDSSFG